MKNTIIATAILIALGLIYAWWWHQTYVDAVTVSGREPTELNDSEAIRENHPHLFFTTRLMGWRLIGESSISTEDSWAMMRRLFNLAVVNFLAGIILASLSLGFLGGALVAQRRLREGNSEHHAERYTRGPRAR